MRLKFISVFVLSVLLSSCIDDAYLDAPISNTIPLTPGVILPLAVINTDVHKPLQKILAHQRQLKHDIQNNRLEKMKNPDRWDQDTGQAEQKRFDAACRSKSGPLRSDA